MNNRYSPHLLILPEDEANEKIANGFTLNLQVNERAIQILPRAGGGKVVVKKFIKDHAPKMRQYLERRFLLLIDFDKDRNLLPYIQNQIPEDVGDRVFVLGVFFEPEDLRKALGMMSFESIGEALADNCAKNSDQLWQHDLLRHNQAEVERMIADVKPFLFGEGKS